MQRPHDPSRRFTKRSRTLSLEPLEQRTMLTVDIVAEATGFGDVQLQIMGTEHGDEVFILDSPSRDSVLVVENGRLHVIDEPFDNIYFEGRGGDDLFVNCTSIPSIATGGSGDDRLYGGSFVNMLVGDDGNDLIFGRGIHNIIWGDSVTSHIDLRDLPDDYAVGTAPGDDTIEGGDEINVIYGGPGDDILHGNGLVANSLNGGSGNDWMAGASGIDYMAGGAGNDLLRGGAGNDVLSGDDGADIVIGGDGNDMLWGGNGRDIVIGGRGKDLMFGSEYDDPVLGFLPRGSKPGDIIIQGNTDYDTNDRALTAILTEWNQPATLRTHMTNLERGVGPFGIYALNSRTVHDDGFLDRLDGIAEGDWIL